MPKWIGACRIVALACRNGIRVYMPVGLACRSGIGVPKGDCRAELGLAAAGLWDRRDEVGLTHVGL